MSDRPNSFVVFHAGRQSPKDNLHLGALLPDSGVGKLIEEAAHRAVAFGGAVTAGFSGALLSIRTNTDPGSELGGCWECGSVRPDFCNDLLGGIYAQAGQFC